MFISIARKNTVNKSKKKGLILGAITGDALGTPLEGMSRGHIRSVFGEIHSYLDPGPGLKHNMDHWKKPGLYSSISQLIILSLMSESHYRGRGKLFCIPNAAMPAVEGSDFSIFRHPGAAERYFIQRGIRQEAPQTAPLMVPDARVVSAIAPGGALRTAADSLLTLLIERTLPYTGDYHTLAGVLVLSGLLSFYIINEGSAGSVSIGDSAEVISRRIMKELDQTSAEVFEYGINPDYLVAAAGDFNEVFTAINTHTSVEAIEQAIMSRANRHFKTPATRATVNHPLCILPMGIGLSKLYWDHPGEALFAAAALGGSTAALASITGMIAGAAHGVESLPDTLVQNLVNRRNIITITDALTGNHLPEKMITGFIDGEMRLTRKEIQDYRAHIRHTDPRIKKTARAGKDAASELSRHVVESWTKLDKARWKKERDKKEKKS